jgi:Predicted multitransmembrane protein
MEKNNEKKLVGIIALVFAILGLVLSWVPIINNVAAVFAVIGIILGIIALIINRKNKKTIALVSTILAIISIIIVLATQSMYSKAADHAGKAVSSGISSAMSSSDKKEADNFKWTKADFDALTVGDSLTGVGGANYDEIVAKYGKPKTSSDTQSGDYTMRNASWSKMTSNGSYESVDLSFIQQQDGSYLLSMKNSSSLN